MYLKICNTCQLHDDIIIKIMAMTISTTYPQHYTVSR